MSPFPKWVLFLYSTFAILDSYRVVAVIAGNTESVTLSNLIPDTQYQVTVAAVVTLNNSTRKYRSNLVVFRTLFGKWKLIDFPLNIQGDHKVLSTLNNFLITWITS